MKESLYDQVVWLLGECYEYTYARIDVVEGFANKAQMEFIEAYEDKLNEVLRLLKNEPKRAPDK